MAKPSNVARLSPRARSRVDELLYESGFADYAGLADQLKAEGYSISKSSLHRYGKRLQKRVTEAELAKLITRKTK